MTSNFCYEGTDVHLPARDFLPVLISAEDTVLEVEFCGCAFSESQRLPSWGPPW